MSDYTREKAEETAKHLLISDYYSKQESMIYSLWDTMRVMANQDTNIGNYIISYDTIFVCKYKYQLYNDDTNVIEINNGKRKKGFYRVGVTTMSSFVDKCHWYYIDYQFATESYMKCCNHAMARYNLEREHRHAADSIRDMVLAHDNSIKAFDKYVRELLNSESFKQRYSYIFEFIIDAARTEWLENEIYKDLTNFTKAIDKIKAGEKLEKDELSIYDYAWL
jgi:hypothetical protein